jgi:hypothetical protein
MLWYREKNGIFDSRLDIKPDGWGVIATVTFSIYEEMHIEWSALTSRIHVCSPEFEILSCCCSNNMIQFNDELFQENCIVFFCNIRPLCHGHLQRTRVTAKRSIAVALSAVFQLIQDCDLITYYPWETREPGMHSHVES